MSHRSFMPKLLIVNPPKGWPHVQCLLVDLFKFMEPYPRSAELGETIHVLYKGTLRVLLVLLHDFPEFLCDYHFSFCDVIPSSCIQMRNRSQRTAARESSSLNREQQQVAVLVLVIDQESH
ncbi:hypothetical protein ACSBR2_003472 [Camellia fascicularis]